MTPLVRMLAARLVKPSHQNLTALSAMSAGDPIKVPLSSSRLTVVRQEALVLGESEQEIPEEWSV
jgi:hypothetical protein